MLNYQRNPNIESFEYTIFYIVIISYFATAGLRPWPNDSIFHSIFSSTFDLKVERLLSVVENRWPNGSIFRSIFCRVKNRVKNRVVWPGPNKDTRGSKIQSTRT